MDIDYNDVNDITRNELMSSIEALLPELEKNYFPPAEISPDDYPKYYDFLKTQPELLDIINFAEKEFVEQKSPLSDILEILFYILVSIVFQKKNDPFTIQTKWTTNQELREKCVKKTVGIGFCGGSQAAQAIATGILSGLNARGLLSKIYIDYLFFVSGATWSGCPLAYEKYALDGSKISNTTLDSLLLPYIPPEQLRITDLLFQKPSNFLISSASNTFFILTFLRNFLLNLLDPEVPFELVLSNAFAQGPLEQFNLYSTKSILQKNKQQIDEVLNNNPIIKEKIDSYFLLRDNFPETYTSIAGVYPPKPANDQYTFFQLTMNSESYGTIANDAIITDPLDTDDELRIGQRIENYGFGSQFKSVIDADKKIIECEVKSPALLASLNQMVGMA